MSQDHLNTLATKCLPEVVSAGNRPVYLGEVGWEVDKYEKVGRAVAVASMLMGSSADQRSAAQYVASISTRGPTNATYVGYKCFVL